jgi:nucleotide-binding universal stress UspA family protein
MGRRVDYPQDNGSFAVGVRQQVSNVEERKRAEHRERGQPALRHRDLIPDQARTFATINTAVVEGGAYRRVLQRAAEEQTDLIVMGVHGRSAIDLLVFGSTTHHVIRAATCPVLIVRG